MDGMLTVTIKSAPLDLQILSVRSLPQGGCAISGLFSSSGPARGVAQPDQRHLGCMGSQCWDRRGRNTAISLRSCPRHDPMPHRLSAELVRFDSSTPSWEYLHYKTTKSIIASFNGPWFPPELSRFNSLLRQCRSSVRVTLFLSKTKFSGGTKKKQFVPWLSKFLAFF